MKLQILCQLYWYYVGRQIIQILALETFILVLMNY